MRKRPVLMRLFWLLISPAALNACTTLKYRVYVLNTKEQKLLAHDKKDDLPLSVCDETIDSKANCYVYRRADFSALIRDYTEKTERLKACETSGN